MNDRKTIPIPITKLVPSRWQPCQSFDATVLLQLAELIQAQGVLVPILIWHNGEEAGA